MLWSNIFIWQLTRLLDINHIGNETMFLSIIGNGTKFLSRAKDKYLVPQNTKKHAERGFLKNYILVF